MRIANHTLITVMLVLSTTSIAVAQIGGGGIGSGVVMGSSMGNPFNAIANLPYSATVKTTVVQKLADGTTITRVNTTKEARDSEGRTMHQTSFERPDGEPEIVNTSVVDPANHTMTHWMSLSITIVSETWHSPELKITLLSVNDDPRTGKRTTEVTDLDRAEPDPSVFQVPEGYTVKDQNPEQPQ
jgi:hypothetical protein